VTCAELEELAAELALGNVSGAERASALDHLAGCAACRELVADLAGVADRMLLLAPVIEPPPGFESKVLARMGVAPARDARPPRYRRLLVAVAAVALVAGLSSAGAAWLSDEAERPVGIRTALVADAGRWTCRAVVYGDRPTWLVVSLDRTDGLSSSFSVEAFHTGSDTPVPVGNLVLDQGHGSLARTVQLPAGEVEKVRVLDGKGVVRYEMTFSEE
jgi:hypothetical protein